jgi:RNase P/RNase MRP subunit p30
MFTDIVFPDDNEKEFIELAERLSIGGLCLCYSFAPKKDYKEIKDRIKRLQEKTKINLSFGLLVRPKDSMKARLLADLLVVKAIPTKNNRSLLEKKEIDLTYELEDSPRRDPMHYRHSGMNQVECAVAKKSEMIIGFSFSMLLNAGRLRKSVLMGRFSQNIMLCRKYRVNTAFASFAKEPYELRAMHEMLSLARTLGMTPGDALLSLGMVTKRIEENRLRKQGKFFGEGIEIEDKQRKS